MKIGKIGLLGGSVLALAIAATSVAQAGGIHPGLWSANGIQEICLVSDGTWFSPTFGSWGGVWIKQKFQGTETGTLVGNYSSGAGNDSMVIKGKAFTWNEWSDDLGTINLAGQDYVWSFISSSCGAPHQGANATRTPKGE